MTEHNGWVKFTALVAIGFYDQVVVIDLSSSDQNADNALLMVDEDLRERRVELRRPQRNSWAHSVGIDTSVPGLYLVEAEFNLESAEAYEPEYRNLVQSPVSYILPHEKPIQYPALTQAAIDALAERQRQIEVKGWTTEHDDQYVNNQLAAAASCYASHVVGRSWIYDGDAENYRGEPTPENWPLDWDEEWWKPSDPRRDRVKAIALLLADVERLDRAEAKGQEGVTATMVAEK